MKKLVSFLILAAAALPAFSQFDTPTPDALYFMQVNHGVTDVIHTFPPVPSSGSFAVVVYDNVTGTPFGVTAIPGVNITYDTSTEVLDSAPADWNATVGMTGFIKNKPTLPSARSFNNAASHALVTTAAAANGFQLSTTRDSSVSYTTTISVTASIAGAGTGYVVLEICPTNSAVAASWVEIARFGNSQSFSLAITLAGIQALDGHVGGMIPAGYYARLRQVSVTGTVSFGANGTGQEVML